MVKNVLVCCNKTCTKQGSLSVLRKLQQYETDEILVIWSGCLGECGNGPMVKIMPSKFWYNAVQVKQAEAIATQHLQRGKPVKRLLFWKYHQQKNYVTVWITIFLGFWATMILLFFVLNQYANLDFGF